MGYSEKTADVRIAQYEKNARTPNAETTKKVKILENSVIKKLLNIDIFY